MVVWRSLTIPEFGKVSPNFPFDFVWYNFLEMTVRITILEFEIYISSFFDCICIKYYRQSALCIKSSFMEDNI